MNPSYFDVNYRGTIGFDTLPYHLKWAPVFCRKTSAPQHGAIDHGHRDLPIGLQGEEIGRLLTIACHVHLKKVTI